MILRNLVTFLLQKLAGWAGALLASLVSLLDSKSTIAVLIVCSHCAGALAPPEGASYACRRVCSSTRRLLLS